MQLLISKFWITGKYHSILNSFLILQQKLNFPCSACSLEVFNTISFFQSSTNVLFSFLTNSFGNELLPLFQCREYPATFIMKIYKKIYDQLGSASSFRNYWRGGGGGGGKHQHYHIFLFCKIVYVMDSTV